MRSQHVLETLHPEWQHTLHMAIKLYDFSALSGFRGEPEQNECYRKGLSKKKYPHSVHNTYPSLAVDVAPYPINWRDSLAFARLSGIIEHCAYWRGHGIRWGGDWDRDGGSKDQTFMDLGHFELKLNERNKQTTTDQ